MSQADANLVAAIDQTLSELGRTDSKAGVLLTLDGLLVAALGLLGSVTGVTLALVAVSAVALVVSVVLALLAIRPRLGSPGVQDRAGFAYWATATQDEIQAGMQEDRRLARVQVLSRVVLWKMTRLRLAGDASLVAVAALAAALITR
ncbi:Pycsar system effector family protein [Streptomyces capillispiralis]|uniref:Pycsar effector protein domain-containing protein n=1 Tax=Streptomyces capillispiralis TaxID=68182 RepID=A0A561TRZ3_9ACTN|nr:Pycsar system effector family protein [Streptomyces capillispiralis]TWF89878.1 hypothetical protein FHX78_116926 [Streptomyces capillispiralis]GHH95700.1 hypothetical protein GCM10017779_61570 [Streptomyces capillispiralis]